MSNIAKELLLKVKDMKKKYKEETKITKEFIIEIEKIIIEINNHLDYMPGGNGYLEAKEHFDGLQK